MSKADSFDPIVIDDEGMDFQPGVHKSIWSEAEVLRKNRELLKFGEKIKCPVIAIHGDYDPHPAKGVEEPLSRTLTDFKFFLLGKCGHYPWKEKAASEEFFELLRNELS